jgi:hypothetical protein
MASNETVSKATREHPETDLLSYAQLEHHSVFERKSPRVASQSFTRAQTRVQALDLLVGRQLVSSLPAPSTRL